MYEDDAKIYSFCKGKEQYNGDVFDLRFGTLYPCFRIILLLVCEFTWYIRFSEKIKKLSRNTPPYHGRSESL